ncbi:MAG: glycosyltransferase family 4 protein [Bacteroidetes bacterium]|nr:glycosyltransferase family 4 protein [Bacteroidota bacterium]
MKKICHITTVHRASDERIFYKECLSLVRHGYEVVLIAPEGMLPGNNALTHISLPHFNTRIRRFFSGQRMVFREAMKLHADLYHFHDPELMPVGVLLSLFGKKVVYDVHEDLPKQVLYKNWIRGRLWRWIASRLIFVAERFSSLFFNGIAAATEDIAVHFPSRKTIILRNFPSLQLMESAARVSWLKNGFTLVYAGGISRIRGILEIIKALEVIGGKVKLLLLGDFDDETYRKECMAETGWQHVDFRGWISISEVYGLMQQADVGIATLYPAQNFLRSLPVKAFEYMACGLPMIMSDFPYWKEIFGSCALFADPQSPGDVAEKIARLAGDPGLTRQLGEAGRKAVSDSYSWEKEQDKLMELYGKILRDGNQIT